MVVTPVVLRSYSWFWVQESLLEGFRGPYVESRDSTWKDTNRESSVNLSEPSFFLGILQQYLKNVHGYLFFSYQQRTRESQKEGENRIPKTLSHINGIDLK